MIKKIKDNYYLYEYESYRDKGIPKKRYVRYIGPLTKSSRHHILKVK
jgi:hypothetical protein